MIGITAASLTILAFVLTTILILWRPRGLNEAFPSTFGAVLVLLSGTVSLSDLLHIGETVSGAAITIMATIIMALVLESFGFFIGQPRDWLTDPGAPGSDYFGM